MLPAYGKHSFIGSEVNPRHVDIHLEVTERLWQQGVWSRPPAKHFTKTPAMEKKMKNFKISLWKQYYSDVTSQVEETTGWTISWWHININLWNCTCLVALFATVIQSIESKNFDMHSAV